MSGGFPAHVVKQAEQPDQTLGQKLLHYAQSLPPLLAALKISRRVARVRFEWPDAAGIWAKIRQEEAELRQELERPIPDPARQAAELGDLLFALVNLGRWYGLDGAQALTETNLCFARRMEELVSESDSTPLQGRTLEE
ncbi:MAG: hypothetical protein Q6L68_02940 [Thermostichus sp. DG02_5_bins_236]